MSDGVTRPVEAVIVVGPLPPPVTGAARNTQMVAERLAERVPVKRLDINSPFKPKSAAYHAHRLWRVLLTLPQLTWHAFRRRCTLYLTISGGLGVFYDIAFLLAARVLGCRIVIHHHNFTYVDRRAGGMACAVRAAGHGATHVFLCDRMRDGFMRHYGNRFKTLIVNNAALTEPRAPKQAEYEGGLRLGMLSNLFVAKGTLDFIATFEALRADNLDVTATLAGPIWDAESSAAIDKARAAHPDRFRWIGPVYGAEKEEFFEAIDIFVFPSHRESEPHVVYEAMAHGLPVIASDKGCIAEQLGDTIAPVPLEQFTAMAKEICAKLSEPSWRRAVAEACRARHAALRERSALPELLALLTGGGAVSIPSPVNKHTRT